MAWQKVKDVGAAVSIAVPIEMNMRHGMPPILKTQELGIEPSLSSDVEVTMTAGLLHPDAVDDERAAGARESDDSRYGASAESAEPWPVAPFAPGTPSLLTTRDVLRYATINGAKDLGLDRKTGSLTPGKEADIILLSAEAINVAPLNHVPGAVVSLMDRTNVETVIVAARCASGRDSCSTSIC